MLEKISQIVIALYIGMAVLSAADISRAHQVSQAVIKSAEARQNARLYLSSLGFSRAGTSALPSKKGVVLINAHTGMVKQSLKQ